LSIISYLDRASNYPKVNASALFSCMDFDKNGNIS